MKLTLFQLEPHLSKKLASCYIVSGEELMLKQEALQQIRKAASAAGFIERTRLVPEAGFDWEELFQLLNSVSLFAEKRLIELDFRDTTPPKAAGILLQEYANNPSPNNILLIDCGKIDDKIAKSPWYNAMEKNGVVTTIWPIPREQMPQWIINRSKKYKLQINLDAAQLLTDYMEGNLVAAAQAIEKIYLLKANQPIDSELMATVLADESHFSIFDFVENLISGNKKRTLHILDSLKNEGIEPTLILWGITREIRLLADMSQQIKQGQTYENLWQKHRIFAKRQPAIRRFLTKTTPENCWQYLLQASHIDKMIKGAYPGNVWEALELFCLRLG